MKNSKARKKKNLNRKPAVIASLIGVVVLATACAGFLIATSTKSHPDPLPMSGTAAVWDAVPVEYGRGTADAMITDFNLRSIIAGTTKEGITLNTFVFRGTIVGAKEYEVSWTDENGDKRGPFKRSILEAKVSEIYHGKSPVSGDTVRILYPYSLSWDFEDAVRIREGGEYIFVRNWVIDDKYMDLISKYHPESLNYESAKHADIYLGGAWDSLFVVDGENVIVPSNYFVHDEKVATKVLPADSIRMDKFTSSSSLKNGSLIVLKERDFREAFMRLFENKNNLPTEVSQR